MAVSVTDDQQKENINPISASNAQPRVQGNGFVLVLKPSSDTSAVSPPIRQSNN